MGTLHQPAPNSFPSLLHLQDTRGQRVPSEMTSEDRGNARGQNCVPRRQVGWPGVLRGAQREVKPRGGSGPPGGGRNWRVQGVMDVTDQSRARQGPWKGSSARECLSGPWESGPHSSGGPAFVVSGGARGSLQGKFPAAEEACDSSQKPAAPQTTRLERAQKKGHLCSLTGT